MTKQTRIYTRTGDDGTTGLVGGTRIAKDSLRIDAIGSLDELSSAVGLACAELAHSARPSCRRVDAWLEWVQDCIFNLGSKIAAPSAEIRAKMPHVGDEDVAELERGIDEAQLTLEPLAQFIHPGGSRAGAHLHYARTLARRAERACVALSRQEEVDQVHLCWLNRLSDALFVWARRVNASQGAPETVWDSARRPPQAVTACEHAPDTD